jgi:hypothetical protein
VTVFVVSDCDSIQLKQKAGATMVSAATSTLIIETISPVDLNSAGSYVILAKTGSRLLHHRQYRRLAHHCARHYWLWTLRESFLHPSRLTTRSGIYTPNYTDPTPATLTSVVSDTETAYSDAAGRTVGWRRSRRLAGGEGILYSMYIPSGQYT